MKKNDYLELLKKCLIRYGFEDKYDEFHVRFLPLILVQKALAYVGLQLVRERSNISPKLRREGRDYPTSGETMIGLSRLDNIENCIVDILKRKVPGDFIETGVWRGGATIFMRAVLKQYNITDRIIWVADSFRGLPKPDPKHYPLDKNDPHWKIMTMNISLKEVRSNFAKYDLLDDRVRFLEGWFKDTLPIAPIKQLALIRLDCDMYESMTEALVSLYPKLSLGGYLIIDDYGVLPNCKAAVKDFRDNMGIKEKIHKVDWSGIYWQRTH